MMNNQILLRRSWNLNLMKTWTTRAITDGMKSSDDYVSNAFLKLNKEKLLRPWDDIGQSDEKG